jgi:glutamate racemase
MDSDAPIGVVDSGVGGLTVARAIADQLPHERISYLGDTANGPYGPLPLAQVRRHTLDRLDTLAGEGAKLLVIACNSGSAACLRDARERYDVPVVEVIVPAVRRATSATRTHRVGVIGTTATVASGAYTDAFAANPDIDVTAVATPRFVEFVERGTTTGRQLLGVVQASLQPILDAQVDTLVLGCTHYPLLSAVISLAVGPEVTLVSSAEETALDVVRTLLRADLERDPDRPAPAHLWRATGDQLAFDRLAERFLGPAFRTGVPA